MIKFLVKTAIKTVALVSVARALAPVIALYMLSQQEKQQQEKDDSIPRR
jgi:hypothetical protein